MCGIVGFTAEYLDPASARHTAKAMAALIRHRGPDGEGYYADTRAALGHRRLSIIDVNGGGQPIVSPAEREVHDPRVLRAQAIYAEDAAKSVRKSHENPSIMKLYDEYFEKPNSHKAHELLHTHYTARPKYK